MTPHSFSRDHMCSSIPALARQVTLPQLIHLLEKETKWVEQQDAAAGGQQRQEQGGKAAALTRRTLMTDPYPPVRKYNEAPQYPAPLRRGSSNGVDSQWAKVRGFNSTAARRFTSSAVLDVCPLWRKRAPLPCCRAALLPGCCTGCFAGAQHALGGLPSRHDWLQGNLTLDRAQEPCARPLDNALDTSPGTMCQHHRTGSQPTLCHPFPRGLQEIVELDERVAKMQSEAQHLEWDQWAIQVGGAPLACLLAGRQQGGSCSMYQRRRCTGAWVEGLRGPGGLHLHLNGSRALPSPHSSLCATLCECACPSASYTPHPWAHICRPTLRLLRARWPAGSFWKRRPQGGRSRSCQTTTGYGRWAWGRTTSTAQG